MNCDPPSSLFDRSQYWTTHVEREFDFCYWQQWIRAFYTSSITHVIIGYVITIFTIKNYMKDRKPFDLRTPLIAWNMLLAIFSLIGSIRCWTEIVDLWSTEGFKSTLSHRGYHYGVIGFWTFLFVLSKMIEFIDTLFIVLRKKPLIFLHYYHHIETCWFSLFSYPYTMPAMRWGMTLNFSVHALMYTYYAIRAANYRPPRSVAMVITSLQTIQMFVGLAIGFSAWLCEDMCGHDAKTVLPGFATYAIYAILFTRYFYRSYFSAQNRHKTACCLRR